MTATPYHLYRTNDQNGNICESEDLQIVKDWRDANAEGAPIQDIVVDTYTYYDVMQNGAGQSFPNDEAAAIAFRDAHMPGVVITTHLETYEVDPCTIVPE